MCASLNLINCRQGWLTVLCASVTNEKNGIADSFIVFAVFDRNANAQWGKIPSFTSFLCRYSAHLNETPSFCAEGQSGVCVCRMRIRWTCQRMFYASYEDRNSAETESFAQVFWVLAEFLARNAHRKTAPSDKDVLLHFINRTGKAHKPNEYRPKQRTKYTPKFSVFVRRIRFFGV